MRRRDVLALTPLAAALLAACGRDDGGFAAGMVPIKWDRDPCARCGMLISDARFAAQVRGGAQDAAFKFDDIGCALTWLQAKRAEWPWLDHPATRFWVADFGAAGRGWLDARRAFYVGGARSPMGYDFAAHAAAQPGALGLDAVRRKVLEAKA